MIGLIITAGVVLLSILCLHIALISLYGAGLIHHTKSLYGNFFRKTPKKGLIIVPDNSAHAELTINCFIEKLKTYITQEMVYDFLIVHEKDDSWSFTLEKGDVPCFIVVYGSSIEEKVAQKLSSTRTTHIPLISYIPEHDRDQTTPLKKAPLLCHVRLLQSARDYNQQAQFFHFLMPHVKNVLFVIPEDTKKAYAACEKFSQKLLKQNPELVSKILVIKDAEKIQESVSTLRRQIDIVILVNPEMDRRYFATLAQTTRFFNIPLYSSNLAHALGDASLAFGPSHKEIGKQCADIVASILLSQKKYNFTQPINLWGIYINKRALKVHHVESRNKLFEFINNRSIFPLDRHKNTLHSIEHIKEMSQPTDKEAFYKIAFFAPSRGVASRREYATLKSKLNEYANVHYKCDFYSGDSEEHISKLIKNSINQYYDALFTLGPLCTQKALTIMEEEKKAIPIVFGDIKTLQDIGISEQPHYVTGIYSSEDQSTENILELLFLIKPHTKNLLLTYAGHEKDYGSITHELEKQFAKKEMYSETFNIEDHDNPLGSLKQRINNFDTIVLLNDNIPPTYIRQLIEICNEAHITAYSLHPTLVEKGASFGYGFDSGIMSQEGARILHKILHEKQKPSTIPIATPPLTCKAFLNAETYSYQGILETEPGFFILKNGELISTLPELMRQSYEGLDRFVM